MGKEKPYSGAAAAGKAGLQRQGTQGGEGAQRDSVVRESESLKVATTLLQSSNEDRGSIYWGRLALRPLSPTENRCLQWAMGPALASFFYTDHDSRVLQRSVALSHLVPIPGA
ncbi:unnamed protein product [Sphagnum troendelagicum]|uniref:Uncharacterized protein n=1 Tax=Sphagnum troendelagicum TaxID=128251 RepID=A0ABP0TJ87_9BRYO